MVPAILAFTLASTTFAPNKTVPTTMVAKDCGGTNVSPELHWTNPPKGTKSFALVVHDPDAPRPGGFYHWTVARIPPGATHLSAGTSEFAGYYGPCPPPGKVHHYNFTLYALDDVVDAHEQLDPAQLLARIKGHVLAQTTLTGLFEATSLP